MYLYVSELTQKSTYPNCNTVEFCCTFSSSSSYSSSEEVSSTTSMLTVGGILRSKLSFSSDVTLVVILRVLLLLAFLYIYRNVTSILLFPFCRFASVLFFSINLFMYYDIYSEIHGYCMWTLLPLILPLTLTIFFVQCCSLQYSRDVPRVKFKSFPNDCPSSHNFRWPN